jgi:uncharacterized protein (TIGR03437 family)
MAGVATRLTAFTINGVNNLSAFAATGIPANGSLYASLSGSGISVPLNRTFQFAGQDSNGATWQQSLVVPFIAPSGPVRIPGIALSVSPSTMQRNPLAAASCQWSQQVTVQETGGYQTTLSAFGEGSAILTSALPTLFGTTRLAPWGLLTGTACYATANVPSQATYSLSGVAETSGTVTASAVASFAAQSAGPATFSTSVPAVSISAPAGSAGLGLNFTGGSPAWTATVIPASRTWLTLSATAGSGNATLQLNASASGLSNGVYNAIVSIQAQDAIPQSIQVPVNFTVGGSSNVSIAGIGNAASGTQAFAPGQLIAVYGSNLSAASAIAGIQPLPLILSTASATVDGVAAPLWFVSPTQINLQIPYETSAGPAVLAINNGGQIASYSFTVQPAAPGIFAFNGSLVPYATGQPGQTVVAFITGDGDVTPSLATGATPSSSDTLAQLPKSRQPLTLTVGGEQATVVFDGIVPGLIGVTQVNFTIPADAKTGVLPVVATVGGVSGAPVNLTVTGGVSSSQQGRAFSLSPLVF